MGRKTSFLFFLVVVLGLVLLLKSGSLWAEPASGDEGSLLIPAAFFANPYLLEESEEELQRLAVENGLVCGGDQPCVQNVQPPSISGFQSDLFTGAATVSYPLDLPDGRGGLTPSLALSYSSATVDSLQIRLEEEEWRNKIPSQSSWVGLGWNLSGLPVIERNRFNTYSLSLNGASFRLIQVDPENGIWRTEPESFMKIVHRVRDNDEPGGGGSYPDDWWVYGKDGTRYKFVARMFFWKRCPSRHPDGSCDWRGEEDNWAASWYKWPIERVIDPSGNQIVFTYSSDTKFLNCGSNNNWYPRSLYLENIFYNSRFGVPEDEWDGQIRISFERARREDGRDGENVPGSDSFCDQPLWADDRLARIAIEIKRQDGTLKRVRQYELDNDRYFRDSKNQDAIHLQLAGIRLLDGDGNPFPTAYTFSYFDDVGNLTTYRLLKSADNGWGGRVVYDYEKVEPLLFNDGLKNAGNWGKRMSRSKRDPAYIRRVTRQGVCDQVEQGSMCETVEGALILSAYEYEGEKAAASNSHLDHFSLWGHSRVVKTISKKNNPGSKLKVDEIQFYQTTSFGEGQIALPSLGRVKRAESQDPSLGNKILVWSENDFEVLDPSGGTFENSPDLNTPYFVYLRENRSCQDPTSETPLGAKTTYLYEVGDQGGAQYGNLTHETQYRVEDCDFPTSTAYRQTHSSYFPRDEAVYIVDKIGGQETLECNSGGEIQSSDCPNAKRRSASWFVYEGMTAPWQGPGERGFLSTSRTFYEFPEGLWGAGSWRTVDTTTSFDVFGNPLTTTTYNSYGVVSWDGGANWSISEPGGANPEPRTTTTGYEEVYNTYPARVSNALGQTSETYYFDASGNRVFSPALSLGGRVRVVDPNGAVSETVLDNFGRPVESYSPTESREAGQAPTQKVGYSGGPPFVLHTQSRDDLGGANPASYFHEWQIYNGLGQVIRTHREKENEGEKVILTKSTYNAQGLAEESFLPCFAQGGGDIGSDCQAPKRSFEYDVLGRRTKTREPDGAEFVRSHHGRLTVARDAEGHVRVFEKDNLGRLVKVREYCLGTGKEYCQEAGPPQLSQAKKTTSGVLGFFKRAFERVKETVTGAIRRVLPPGEVAIPTEEPYATTSYEYDVLDRLVKVTDAKENVTQIHYNQFGQKDWVRDPDLGLWRYAYYPSGTLAVVTDAKTQVRSFDYDLLDRTLHQYYGVINPANVAVTFIYDRLPETDPAYPCDYGIGRRCKMIDQSGSTDYDYDLKGRLVFKKKTITGEGEFSIGYTYDAFDRVKTTTYPDGEVVTNDYNEAAQLVRVAGEDVYLKEAYYNALGLPEKEVYGNRAQNRYAYEPESQRLHQIQVFDGSQEGRATGFGGFLGRLAGQGTGKNLLRFVYGYDHIGNVTSLDYNWLEDGAWRTRNIAYRYDPLSRLTEMPVVDGYSARYEYDEIGNMILKEEIAPQVATPIPSPLPGGARSVVGIVGPETVLSIKNTSGVDGVVRLTMVSEGLSWREPRLHEVSQGQTVTLRLAEIDLPRPDFEGYVLVDPQGFFNQPMTIEVTASPLVDDDGDGKLEACYVQLVDGIDLTRGDPVIIVENRSTTDRAKIRLSFFDENQDNISVASLVDWLCPKDSPLCEKWSGRFQPKVVSGVPENFRGHVFIESTAWWEPDRLPAVSPCIKAYLE